MGASWGKNIKITIFGESHGKAVGITLSGLPAGLALDLEQIWQQLKRRAPGQSQFSTARKEADQPDILSGLYRGYTTGTPLCAIIPNKDVQSEDYDNLLDLMRPGHADYPSFIRYKGFADPRGGGHSSGRLTAPLVFAGAICKQILAQQGISICAHIQSIKDVNDTSYAEAVGVRNQLEDILDKEIIEQLASSELPLLDTSKIDAMTELILQTKNDQDSVGGVVECAVLGVKAGVGEPFFDSIESTFAHLLFSIPAIKGVEFGLGFNMTTRMGSQSNDSYYYEDNLVKTKTNHCGGVLGGISTGMPIVFRVAIRPTPSIAKEQDTISISQAKVASLSIKGRHDPCIVPRAVPVIEAVAALAILDLMKE